MKPICNLVYLAADALSDTERIKAEISKIKDFGFDGAVLYTGGRTDEIEYLSTDYMKAVSEIALYMKSVDLALWICDEAGDVPCSCCGEVEYELPALQGCWLEAGALGVVEKHYRTGVNMFDPVGTDKFISLTYERYKSGLSKDAFAYISGFFCDGAGFLWGRGAAELGGVPWYDGIAEDYAEQYKEDISEFEKCLPVLFDGDDEDARVFHARYYNLLTERLKSCCIDKLGEWCRENGKRFMAGVGDVRTLLKQAECCGSALLTLKTADVPLVDSIGRQPSDCLTPRIASSLARQFGSGESACMVFEGAGWGLSPADVYLKLERLIECGINTFIFHACRETLNYAGITDRPPSILNLPWKPVLPEILGRLSHLAEIEFKRPRKILLMVPTQAVWESYIPGGESGCADALSDKSAEIAARLHEIGRRFDITNEVIFENEAEFTERGITIGNVTYRTILVTPGCSLSKKGMMYIERAKANGVRILSDIPTSDTEVIPLELIKSKTAEIVREKIIQSDWSVTFPKSNRFVLKPEFEDGNAVLTFTTDSNFDPPPIRLLISDECGEVSINNIIVSPESRGGNGVIYDITDNILGGKNTILLKDCSAVYACIIGEFRVIAKNGYLIFDERQVQTTYDFIIMNSAAESNHNLTESGYPQCTDFSAAKKIFIARQNILHPYLKIDCRNFSAAEVKFDGEYIGCVYGGNEMIEIPSMESGQQHLIEVKVYSSAYNSYGPNFYYKGDSGLITSSQYLGIKNFADDIDAPEVTRNRRMKLTLWSLPANIEIVQKF